VEGGKMREQVCKRGLAAIALVAAVLIAPAGLLPAFAASTINVHDEARLKLASGSGSSSDLIESGQAKGTVPGSVKARLNVGSSVIVSFTIYPKGGGSISGHGSAKVHTTGPYATFAGTVSIVRGTGAYAHTHGTAQVYGAINRETLNATVQVIGKIQR
jgi:hypothetical protein